MSPQTEHSEEPGALPPAELNPLLNPLLADNMTRWAHVYFSNPPEKRDQAVQELLRQLEAESPAPIATAVPAPAQQSEPIRLVNTQAPQEQSAVIVCRDCGRRNSPAQRFCGTCGTRLATGPAADLPRNESGDEPQQEGLQITDVYLVDEHHTPQGESASFGQHEESYIANGHQEQEQYEVPRNREVYQPSSNTNELSLFQDSREVNYDDEPEQIFSVPRSSGSYRIYIGIILALILGALAYKEWRSSQDASQSSLAPPVATREVDGSEPSPPTPTKSDTPDRTASTEKQPAITAGRTAEPARTEPARTEPARTEPARTESVGVARTTTKQATPATAHANPRADKTGRQRSTGSGGGEELATAQSYLNGAHGRNSAEAARWLWKAIAKHNAEASLLLSDLYLRGDGVSKNCDQARVLLDSAALKGVKDAGPRLRHLQAFGCQ